MGRDLLDLVGEFQVCALLSQLETVPVCESLLQSVLQTACFVVTRLAKEQYVGRGAALYVVRQLEAIQVRHCLEACEH